MVVASSGTSGGPGGINRSELQTPAGEKIKRYSSIEKISCFGMACLNESFAGDESHLNAEDALLEHVLVHFLR